MPELFDYRDRAGVFSEVSGLFPLNANITGMDRPERAEVLLVDVSYFDLLGVKAQTGRFFARADYVPGIAEVAVISDALWRRHYGADPGAVGQDSSASTTTSTRSSASRLATSATRAAFLADRRRRLGAGGLARLARFREPRPPSLLPARARSRA